MDFWNVLPHGTGFALWSGPHLAWLAIFAAVTLALCLVYRRCGARGRPAIETAIAAVLGAGEVSRLAVIALQGQMGLGWLPLHYCGLAIFIEMWYAAKGGEVLGDILYATCMPGALMALLFPDWTDYPAFCFLSQNSFVIHILLVGYPIMLVWAGRIRPRPRNIPKCFLFLLACALPMYFFDRWTGTNFMFLNWPSPGSPLEWFASLGRPGYLIGYLPIAAAVWTALYLPWGLAGRRARRRETGSGRPPAPPVAM